MLAESDLWPYGAWYRIVRLTQYPSGARAVTTGAGPCPGPESPGFAPHRHAQLEGRPMSVRGHLLPRASRAVLDSDRAYE